MHYTHSCYLFSFQIIYTILCFQRNANKQKLEELLNSQYVDRVEIVMKEQIGVKGLYFIEQSTQILMSNVKT